MRTPLRTRASRGVLAAAVCLLMPAAAAANDTIETWDEGALDVELNLAYEGLGRVAADRSSGIAFLVGYGIVPRLAVYTCLAVEGDGAMSSPAGSVSVGLFGTPLDTRHVDLDLVLDTGTSGTNFREWTVAPSFELNFDARPEDSPWGAYLRGGVAMRGRPVGESGNPVRLALEAALGAYVRPAPAHQILLEGGASFHPVHGTDLERPAEIGAVSLGYNVVLNERVELLTAVSVDVPQGNERLGIGLFAGLILTLPDPGRSAPEPTPPRP